MSEVAEYTQVTKFRIAIEALHDRRKLQLLIDRLLSLTVFFLFHFNVKFIIC
jgi:hypothetical protein